MTQAFASFHTCWLLRVALSPAVCDMQAVVQMDTQFGWLNDCFERRKVFFFSLGKSYWKWVRWLYKNGSCGKPQKMSYPMLSPKIMGSTISRGIFLVARRRLRRSQWRWQRYLLRVRGFTLTSPGFVQGCSRWCGWFSQWEHPLLGTCSRTSARIARNWKYFLGPLR